MYSTLTAPETSLSSWMRMEQRLVLALKVLESHRLGCPGRCFVSELNRAALCTTGWEWAWRDRVWHFIIGWGYECIL